MKKKGFTLVELLATIVVLSVIALIAVPIVINVIEKAKKSALVSSVNGLVESANMYYTNEIIKGDISDNVIFDFEEGIQTSINKLSYKGKVYNGKLILTSDSDVITCIDDGKYYAYKEKNSDEIVSGIGTCLYDGTTGDFTIESDIDVIQKECDSDKQELQDKIDELTDNVNNLETLINEKEYEISNLQSTIDNLNNEITVLTGEKEDLQKQLELSNTSNSELLDKINELNNEITTLKGTIDSLNSEITVLEGEKEELTNQLALSNTNNTELQNKITNLNKEITSLKETISNNETTITNLTTEKNNLTNELTQANNDKTTLQNQINELNGTIATLESSIEAKGNEITTLNGEKKVLQDQLTAKTNELATLNENLGKVTATASDVLSGKTILTSSGLVTGSMTNNGSISQALNAGGSYTIPKGYHDGTGKVIANTLASQTSATATAGNILSGKTAYVNGNKITGTIASKAAATYTPTTSNQTIASGQYLSGVQTIKGDSNLVAANIKKGTSIFGVTGTYTSDANAAAGNILKDKTAYVNGSKITGTMANKSGATVSATTVTESGTNALISIPANGYYSTSSKISVPISEINNNLSGNFNVKITCDETYNYISFTLQEEKTKFCINMVSFSGHTMGAIYINGVRKEFDLNTDTCFTVKKGDTITLDYGYAIVLKKLYFI